MKSYSNFFFVFFGVSLLLESSYCLAQAGGLDINFGAGGKVITDLQVNSTDNAKSIAIQNDNKILVAGISNSHCALVRYNADGTLDNTFGQGGIAITNLGTSLDEIHSIIIQNDGKIIAAGTAKLISGKNVFALVRYNSNGSLDSTFDADGINIIAIGNGNSNSYAVTLQPDDKILIAGKSENSYNYYQFALIRLNTNGSLDSLFGTGGKVTTSIGNYNSYGNCISLQTNGKILIAGGSTNGSPNWDDFALIRYDTDGSIDSTFGSNGIVTTDFGNGHDIPYSMALQTDGKIVVAGWTEQNSDGDFAFARYNNDGTPDNTFGLNGKVTLALGSFNDYCLSTAIESDGKIVGAGWTQTYSGADFALVRLKSDGSVDDSFNSTGTAITDFNNRNDGGNSVAIQTDGKIVVAGTSYGGNNSSQQGADFAVARYYGGDYTLNENENKTTGRLKIFPNPTNGIFKISCSTSATEKIMIKIINSKGQVVYEEVSLSQGKEYHKEIDLSKVGRGTYYIELNKEGEKTLAKIIVE